MAEVERNSNYWWERVNALRASIARLDSTSKKFMVPGSEGSVRHIMSSALLQDSLSASFTQAVEVFRPHLDDMTKLESFFHSIAKKVIDDVIKIAKQNAEVINWTDVAGNLAEVHDPYNANQKEGEDSG